MTVTIMDKPQEATTGGRRRTIAIVAGALAILVGAPFAAGVYQGYTGGDSGPMPAITLVAVLVAAVALVVGVRAWRRDYTRTLPAGEAREAGKRRLFWTILGTLFVGGFMAGLFGAAFEIGTDGGWMTGTLPPALSLAIAVTMTAAMAGGTWLFYRRIDEYERLDNYIAGAWGANALLIGYPAWYVLWKGGWVAEPSHEALFIALFAVTTASYLMRKFR